MEIPLSSILLYHTGLLQQILAELGTPHCMEKGQKEINHHTDDKGAHTPRDQALGLTCIPLEPQLYVFSKAAAVVIHHCLCVAKGFEQWVHLEGN